MLLDFCDGRLDPVISCDKVSVDGYSIQNLTSTDIFTRNKGFIAEYFIRPPINVKVTFPCNIQIYRVVINPVVGSQKSTGFEIFTCCNDVQQGKPNRNEKSTQPEMFFPVGRTVLTEPSVICFQSVHFRVCDQWRPDNLPKLEDYPNRRELRHHKIGHLNFVSKIMIKINRTVGGSAACIRRLEVWGKPTHSCPESVHLKIRQILFPSLHTDENVKSDENDKAATCSNKVVLIDEDESVIENGVEIPEEFIDCITYEMMTIPLLLPCGKNIDQSTLEKHIAAEAVWGRLACDPFTGVLLDSKNQALPNSHLKSRIDQFLLRHVDSLKNLPRTLGKVLSEDHRPSTSRLVQIQKEDSWTKKLVPYKIETEEESPSLSMNLKPTSINQSTAPSKRKYFEHVNNYKTENIPSCSNSEPEHVTKKLCHEDDLQESLNSALSLTLGNLPSFRKSIHNDGQEPTGLNVQTGDVTEQANSSKILDLRLNHGNEMTSVPEKEVKCVNCHSTCTQAWYKLPCDHLYCRDCLTSKDMNSSSVECQLCDKTCSKSSILRVYCT